MKLYHGTKGTLIDKVLASGLEPRGKRSGNWKHTISSNRDTIYLTDAYAPYFACQASKHKESGMIVEVDTNLLFTLQNLVPDEDVLAQAGAINDQDGLSGTLIQRTKVYRKRLRSYRNSDAWITSLRAMGTCGHLGPIPPEAISRIAIIPADKMAELLFNWDASISLLNYKYLAPKYRAQTARLFGGPPHEEAAAVSKMMMHGWQIPVSAIVHKLAMGKIIQTERIQLPDERPSMQELMAGMSAGADVSPLGME